MFLATITVDTRGAIPNRDIHVGQPLARIVSQAFAYAIRPQDRILSDAVRIRFYEEALLEPGTLVEIDILVNAFDGNAPSYAAVEQAIAESIHHSGMFNCRNTKGAVKINIFVHASHLAVQPTEEAT